MRAVKVGNDFLAQSTEFEKSLTESIQKPSFLEGPRTTLISAATNPVQNMNGC